MLDFGISAITNFLRIYLIYRFVNIFFEKTEEKRERIFLEIGRASCRERV